MLVPPSLRIIRSFRLHRRFVETPAAAALVVARNSTIGPCRCGFGNGLSSVMDWKIVPAAGELVSSSMTVIATIWVYIAESSARSLSASAVYT